MNTSNESPTTSQQSYERPVSRFGWAARILLGILIVVGLLLLADSLFHHHAGQAAVASNEGTFLRGAVQPIVYKPIDLKAMSNFDLDQMNGQLTDIPAQFRALDGLKVKAIGHMWAPEDAGDDGTIRKFQLCYSLTQCCFNGPPLAQHFVDSDVVQVDGKWPSVYFVTDDAVTVTGTLRIVMRKDDDGVIRSIYHMDVESVGPYVDDSPIVNP